MKEIEDLEVLLGMDIDKKLSKLIESLKGKKKEQVEDEEVKEERGKEEKEKEQEKDTVEKVEKVEDTKEEESESEVEEEEEEKEEKEEEGEEVEEERVIETNTIKTILPRECLIKLEFGAKLLGISQEEFICKAIDYYISEILQVNEPKPKTQKRGRKKKK